MRNKIYRRLAVILSISMMCSICMPVMAETGETEIVEEHVEENITDIVIEKNIWKGEVKENNRIYLDENGEKAIGLQKIEDKIYFFNEEGIVQTGWQKVDGVEYYFSKETGERYEERIEEIDGIQYSFNKEGEYSIVEDEIVLQETTPETEILPEDDSVEEENKIENPIAETVQTGWIETVEGKKYLDAAGNPLKGMQTIEEKLYYFDIETGVLQYGWITVGENRYFASESGILYRNQLIWFGKTAYCMGADGSVQYGIVNLNGIIYHTDEKTGQLNQKSGWIEKDEKKYFVNANGVLYRNQLIWFGKTAYCMGADGSVQYGIVNLNGTIYHTDEKSGQLIQKSGWIEKDGKKYFANANGVLYQNQLIWFGKTAYCMGMDGSVQYGIAQAGGKYYHTDEKSGQLIQKSGWIEKDRKKYFANANGVLYQNQLIWFGKTAYCMGTDGSVQYGIVNLNGTIYHTDEKSGQLIQKSGWIEKDGKKYFANVNGVLYRNQLIWFGKTAYCMGADGSVQYGIAQAGGKYYHTDEKTGQVIQKAGWVEKDGKKYYASVTGQMYQNQFIAFGTTWYYCGNDAAIVKGKQVIGGVIYNFDSNGIMKKEGGWGEYNGNKYYKNPATGFPYKAQWVTFGQTWYYANANGFMVSGWQTINGYRYYFYPSTKIMARNTTIDGIRIGADGRVAFYSDRMAVFSTVSTNNANGTYNMKRALSSFNQVIIQPGQTLSFFGIAGPCGQAEGYLPAGVVGGVGYGGGICQASTTLYGAALRAGLTIVERRNHSVPSTYVPIGQDAMVDYGSSDLKIKNDYDFPVKFVTYSNGNTLYAEVWGTQPGWFDYVNIESWYTSGNSAVAYRKYIKNGNTVRVEQLPSSFYY